MILKRKHVFIVSCGYDDDYVMIFKLQLYTNNFDSIIGFNHKSLKG